MLRLAVISGLCVGLMTGCATTSKLMPFKDKAGQTPMQQVLHAQPEIAKDYQNTSIEQVFNRAESPTVSRITVIQTGLLDDSVRAMRTEYMFKRLDNAWQLQNKQLSYQCARAKSHRGFQTAKCN
ncbi:hypothetical protein [Acinetobacter soli]|uniref:hypothetical protein n=1 Tax=Acinetobacter soli TaxID=487316 RepID=UPI000E6A9954|nr:hypothetical protein [Acinetobacter soli]